MACSGVFCVPASLSEAYSLQAFLSCACVWLVGAFIGYLLPRPKASPGSPSSLLFSFASGSGVRKLLLTFHGLVIIREVWYHFTWPGTFRRLSCAAFKWLSGKGWDFEFPAEASAVSSHPLCSVDGFTQDKQQDLQENWYVTEKDLAFFKHHGLGNGELKGATPWEMMMEKEVPNMVKYTAYRRTLPCGKTEYKSVTICPDATAEEFSDMYFDDDFRPNWDAMIIHHSVLEHGDFSQRQQVVHWLRRFPFSFITDREYVIARRRFADDSFVYGITKAIDHPRAPSEGKVVKMDVFYSMWGIKNVACPWGSDKPACETTLLHHEQFKIPENLSRFAVRHAMWGFVKNLSKAVPCFVAMRRQRCEPFNVDTSAYGAEAVPNPPMERADTSISSLTQSSACSVTSDDASGEIPCNPRLSKKHRSRSMKGLAAFAIASGVALLLKRSSSSNLDDASRVQSKSGRHRRQRQRYESFESL